MNPRILIPILILIAFYLLLGVAVFGGSNGGLMGRPRRVGSARPPRLFLNGEMVRVATTGRKVVVMSAQWDAASRNYVYTVIPK